MQFLRHRPWISSGSVAFLLTIGTLAIVYGGDDPTPPRPSSSSKPPSGPGASASATADSGLPTSGSGTGADDAGAPRQAANVRVERLARHDVAPRVALTGEIKARIQSDLAFRVSGKIVERTVDVGDHVAANQVLARLDPQLQQANIDTARAGVASAKAVVAQASANFDRQKFLLGHGATSRQEQDQAEEQFHAAQAALETATAQLAVAEHELSYTTLRATTAGVITSRRAETGQVIQAGEPAFSVATAGARDAVFQIDDQTFGADPARAVIDLALLSDPRVTTRGTVREVSPAVDPATGTFTIKVALEDTPPAMTLGAAVTGLVRVETHQALVLPSSALFSLDRQPAVWVVNPDTSTVSLMPVVIDRYETGAVVLSAGLTGNETIVTAGGQLLRPGQKVIVENRETRR
jgi:RND family efflux transporter MFP subunit